MLSEEELGADKVLALYGRAEARDFVDVHRLSQRLGLERLCHLAGLKDRGFSTDRLVEAMRGFERHRRQDFDVDDAEFDHLRRWTTETISHLERSRGPER